MNAARFCREQSGEGLISGLYTMLVLAIILFLAVEIAAYGMSVWKVYGACDEIMAMMKAENGLDSAMRQRFRELTAALHLESLELRLDGTPPKVQRGDLLELWAQGKYTVRCLKPFGQSLSVPVSVRLHGLAHTYIRRN